MTTETKRDLRADLAFCNKSSVIGVYVHEATKAWPHAIKRALASEAEANRLRTERDQLRAGIAAAMTYPPGIIRAKLRKVLEAIADGA
ncbi:hypothetical protein BSK66_07740 [Paenibacillus odorifer]|uniref:Uncharacterized protein n=1 Tax=Paenibacillus odorifer TaxID=189426 RepID=A0A1R0X2N5_9BACL|nr:MULTISPECIES: hypothetical protein [Paenibacillus]ETT64894.1 hypothetical protein C171_07757 [Paenibacillus sp. FSL H8-237]OMD27451.1 hypothetical protein BJP51_24970 [Paenibacillus odorifer]OME61013.1 hypothetical protein BSK66_07740 [Paenibacillus odorifer]